MKRSAIALLAGALCALTVGITAASAATTRAVTDATASHQGAALQLAAVSDTVRVQLAVVGAVIFVVVIIGLLAYAVRKRLGLVPPPPDQTAGGQH